jgi:hypothetical protein
MPELSDELRRVLDALPAEPEPERSRLDPFRAYILRWRREGRSYRQIQSILQNQCGVRIAYGPLRRFVIRRSRPRKRVDVDTEPQTAEPVTVTVKKSPEPAVKADRWAAERERMRRDKAQPVVEQKPWWKASLEYDEDAAYPPYSDRQTQEGK